MKRIARLALASSLILGGAAGASTALADGEGHTPITVCHWVPAGPGGNHEIAGPDGGSYVVIVVDDDAATGNANGQGHAGHEHDLFGDPTCNQDID
jgi:hypothetical protein